jgi:hypothetical protein
VSDFRPAYAALADALRARLGAAVREVSRQNLPAGHFTDQPALLVLENGGARLLDGDSQEPLLHQLRALLVLYVKVDAESEQPGDDVTNLVGLVSGALEWREGEPPCEDDGASTTLGGEVRRAWLGDWDVVDDVADASQMTVLLNVTMEV